MTYFRSNRDTDFSSRLAEALDAEDAATDARFAGVVSGYKDHTQRVARTRWNMPSTDDMEQKSSEWVGSNHPSIAALRVARRAFSDYEVHGDLELSPGMLVRKAGAEDGQYATANGSMTIEGRIAMPSGHTVHFDTVIDIKDGRAYEPVVLRADGVAHIIAQQTFDAFRDGATFYKKDDERLNMFSPPPDSPDRSDERAIVSPGMFAVMGERAARAQGVPEAAYGVAEGRPAQYQSSRIGYFQDISVGLQDGEHIKLEGQGEPWRSLDPAERPLPAIHVGCIVKAADDITVKGTGCVLHTVEKGTEGVVLRDFDGTGNSFVVEFPFRTVLALATDLVY